MLNAIKKKYEKLLEEKKKKSNKKNENNEINENDEAEEGEDKNNEDDYDENNRNLYLNRIQDRDFMSPEERKLKEERLKNLFKNKVFEMKDYLHRHFMKFYYNGIFIEMKRKAEAKPTKVVKSQRFSNLINKFNNPNPNPNNNNNVTRRMNRIKTTVPKINNNNNEDFNVLQKMGTIVEKININDN